MSVENEIKKLKNLLNQEKGEDLAQYHRKMQGTSFKERREQGVLWYPVQVDESRYDAGERLIVKISRTPEHNQNHSFQSGKSVTFFSNSETEENGVSGVVNQVREKYMFITLNCDELPKWANGINLGVQLLFDENTYKEMNWALDQLISSEDNRLNELKDLLIGEKEPSFKDEKYILQTSLNKGQELAVSKVLNAKDVAIVHGPPGTGKTTTMVEAIKETLKLETQVLVCAPSNAAVDLLVEKLTAEQIDCVRIGHPARVTDELLNKTLDAKVATHNDYKLLKDLRKRSEEYFQMGGKWKRNFGASEREQRKMLLSEARKLKSEAEKLSNYISGDVLFKTRVVACTLVGANHSKLKGMKFSTVFIDEAGQGLEPATWIPITKANRVVFAGDHQQLPPTVKSFEAGRSGLNETLFEKVVRTKQVDVMLREQYRMNLKIMGFSNKEFYNNALMANAAVANHLVEGDDEPVLFIDTAGTGFFEAVNRETKSTFNKEEGALVIKHLSDYLLAKQEVDIEKVGVIAPYRAQVEVLKGFWESSNAFENWKNKVQISTVDSFQGQECDVVYISLVRSNEEGEIGFLSDERRMNVALTRAKKRLVVIGDSATIASKNQFYGRFLDYVNEIEAYKSAFEFLYD